MSDKLEHIVATYFADLRDKHGLGAGTPERSYYPAVAKLLDAIGDQLKPKVLCLSDLGNTGSGQPDFGLYVANQVQKGEPRKGQLPERGVIEMKPVKDDAWLTADTKQVSKYWGAYPKRGMAFALGNQAKRPQTWQLLGVVRLDEQKQSELFA